MTTTAASAYFCLSASARCSRSQVMRMKAGLSDLAIVAAAAPLLGFFATTVGIVGSFRGGSGSRESLLAALLWSLTTALWPAAFGILIGLLASWIRRWILNRAQDTAWRLNSACEELAHSLASTEPANWKVDSTSPVPAKTMESSLPHFQKAAGALTIAALLDAWALQPSDLWFVIFAFLLSLFPAQVLARMIFQHRGGVFPIAAVMSCFWCAIAG